MELKKLLDGVSSVAISGHIRPDGDCVGSTMGLFQYLKSYYPKLQVDVYLEEIPNTFTFIKATKEIKHQLSNNLVYDLFFVLDCAGDNRLGFSKLLYDNAKKTCCIDHHISNGAFAMENYIIPTASSTSELIYTLLEKDKITKEIAECLYLGIVHDTGVFQYASTSPETMEAAAVLMRTGIQASYIIDHTYYQKTYEQNQILGKVLLESTLWMGGICIAGTLSKEEMDFFHVKTTDLEGIVSQLRVTAHVEVAIFAYELSHEEYKVSLRSNGKVDVSVIASHFGGGGHKAAAGFNIQGTSSAVVEIVCRQIRLQLS